MTCSNSGSVRVKLELFEGPLDLLLHLIRSNHIDISAVNISDITDQYLSAIELMKELNLDVAGEYLLMAATLLLIKSRMLLPPNEIDDEDEDENDPRTELVRRLREYEVFRRAGSMLSQYESTRSNRFSRPLSTGHLTEKEWIIDASVVDLLKALQDILNTKQDTFLHVVRSHPVSVRQKMTDILNRLNTAGPLLFSELFSTVKSRQEIIALFLAILELVRIQAVRARQKSFAGDIRLVATGQRSNGQNNG